MALYLDYAATTPVRPEAAQAAVEVMTAGFGNPSSVYPLGKAAALRRDADREIIAKALGCAGDELFFTSCGTESDNWAIQAAVEANCRVGKHIITTAIEHSAVLEPVKRLAAHGYEVTYLKPDKTGHIAPADLSAALREDTVLVSMMLVNNELGTILPVKEAGQAIKAKKNCQALFHVDAVQAFLKVPFTPDELGCDLLSLSAHKIMAPKGIGALYVRRALQKKIKPLMLGGGQERGYRPGTEATAQIAAFAAAVAAWKPEGVEAMGAVKEYAADVLSAIDGVEIITRGDAPHILPISVPAFSGQALVQALGSKEIYISSGSACHRGKPSHVFAAMPLSPKVRLGAARISFGPDSTTADVDALADVLRDICARKSLMF